MSRIEIVKKSAEYLTGLKLIKPAYQRMIIKSKVDEIVKYQLDYIQKYSKHNFIGSINIHYLTLTENYYLLDGQHRFEAIKILFENHSHNYDYYTEFIYVDSIEQLKENFSILNKNTPLPEFSFDVDRSILKKTASHFQHHYPKVWSTKEKARRPKININRFQESLAYLTKIMDIKHEKELISFIEDKNKQVDIKNLKNITSNMIGKANESKFNLILYPYISESEYGYEWANITNIPNKTKKVSIPKCVRDDCWERYIGEKTKTVCPVCNNREIKYNNFEAGHVMSEKQGGLNTVDNLIPICGPCNKSMSDKHMEDFVKTYYPDNYENLQNLLNKK